MKPQQDDDEIDATTVGGFCADENPTETCETDEGEGADSAEAIGTALAVASAAGSGFVPRTEAQHAAAAFVRLLRWLSVPHGRATIEEHSAAVSTRVAVATFLIMPEASAHDSLASIARRFGLSRERVSQLAAAAFPRHVNAGGPREGISRAPSESAPLTPHT